VGWGGAGGTCRRPARYLWCADNSRRLSPRVRVHHATSARRSWRRCARMYVRRCGRRGCVRVKVNGGVYVGHEAAGARGSPVVNGIKLFNHKFFPLLGGNILSAIFSLSLSLPRSPCVPSFCLCALPPPSLIPRKRRRGL